MTQEKSYLSDTTDRDSFGARFGELVKYRRGTEGVTQEELAYRAFKDPSLKSRISELENGKIRNPQQRTVDALCVALDIQPEEISHIRLASLKHEGERLSKISGIEPEGDDIQQAYSQGQRDAARAHVALNETSSMAKLERTSLGNLAAAISSLGQEAGNEELIKEGVALYEEAIADARNARDITAEIVFLNDLAEILQTLGRGHETVEMRQKAVELLKRALSLSRQARTTLNNGNLR